MTIAPSKPKKKIRVTATQMGIVTGILAVTVGVFFEVRPPEAYGVCMACHGRDLINWIVNMQLGTRLAVAPASAVLPLLTTVGVLIGGFAAAITNNEFQWKNPDNPIKTFVYGFLVMNFALLAAGCSIRLLLRAAAGEMLGFVGFGFMAVGIVAATYGLRWVAQR